MSSKRVTLQSGRGGGGGAFESYFIGASPEKVAAWKREPDKEDWASMDYDERWRLTNTLYPHVLVSDPKVHPLLWPELEIALWWWKWWKRVS